MQAWQVTSNGEPEAVFQLAEIEPPAPGPGEVQLRVLVAGLGLPDVFMCKGCYAFEPQIPFTPGQEVVGIVSALGEGVAEQDASLQLGARVMAVTTFYNGHGGLAEYCIAAADTLYAVPDYLPENEAAGFAIPYHTAYIGLQLRAGIKPGEIVVVHGGSGGTGTAAIRTAKALGATVIATASSEDKREFCRQLDADFVFDPGSDELPQQVMEASEGRGADIVYDPVGGELFENSTRYIANGGRLLAVGFACGRWGEIPTARLIQQNCSVMGVYVGAYSRQQMLQCHEQMLSLYQQQKIRVDLDSEVAFNDIPGALQRLSSRGVLGKMVARIATS